MTYPLSKLNILLFWEDLRTEAIHGEGHPPYVAKHTRGVAKHIQLGGCPSACVLRYSFEFRLYVWQESVYQNDSIMGETSRAQWGHSGGPRPICATSSWFKFRLTRQRNRPFVLSVLSWQSVRITVFHAFTEARGGFTARQTD